MYHTYSTQYVEYVNGVEVKSENDQAQHPALTSALGRFGHRCREVWQESAQFIRGVLAAACIPKCISESQIPMMKGTGYAQVPRAVAAPIVQPSLPKAVAVRMPEPDPEPPAEDPRVTGNWDYDNFDPDACYESLMTKGSTPDAAAAKTHEWIAYLNLDTEIDWHPIDTTDADATIQ